MLNEKEIPCIPHIIYDNKFVTDFPKKVDLFNCFFFPKEGSATGNNDVLSSSTDLITDQYLSKMNSRRILLKESIENSILTKLTAMT